MTDKVVCTLSIGPILGMAKENPPFSAQKPSEYKPIAVELLKAAA
jgi:hypothetical protein